MIKAIEVDNDEDVKVIVVNVETSYLIVKKQGNY